MSKSERISIEKKKKAFWTPQPGPQVEAAICPADNIFFGGSKGGGKSDCVIGRHLYGAEKYRDKWNGLIIRRKYKDLAEIRRRFDELIREGLPAIRVGGDQQTNFIRFRNGAQITLAAVQKLEQVDDYFGHQYTEISFDECTTFPFFVKMVDKMKGSLRSPHGVPCQMFFTGNPGGSGHQQVKDFFKIGEVPPKTPFFDEIGESRVFIPSFLRDNRILWKKDPKYVKRLLSIQDPILKKAWLEGDWEIYLGQAFMFRKDRHVINPIPVPEHAPLYMTFDWGYAKPFSVGWWWVDFDNRLYRFAEWYGWNGTPDEGLRLTDEKIAEGIIEREIKMGIRSKPIIRLCDPTCFNKKPDYKGGGQGPSTAEVFARYGIYLSPGDPSRELKIRQFRSRLAIPQDEKEMPMLVVYSTCTHFIRTIPSLCMDELNPEDIDTEQEDHVYDEATLICMARPISMVVPEARKSEHDRRIEKLLKEDQDSYEMVAIREQELAIRDLGVDDYNETEGYEDRGELVSTML